MVTVGGRPVPVSVPPVVREADGDDRTEGLADPALTDGLGLLDALTDGDGLCGDAETASAPFPSSVLRRSVRPTAASEPVAFNWSTTTAVGTVSATTAAAASSTRVRADARRQREEGAGSGATRTGSGSRSSGAGSGSALTGSGSGSTGGSRTGASGSAAVAAAAAATVPATAVSAFPRPRAASARIQRRWTSTNSSAVAPQRRANRSTGANSPGTASPLQYRWSVDVLTCSRPASTP